METVPYSALGNLKKASEKLRLEVTEVASGLSQWDITLEITHKRSRFGRERMTVCSWPTSIQQEKQFAVGWVDTGCHVPNPGGTPSSTTGKLITYTSKPLSPYHLERGLDENFQPSELLWDWKHTLELSAFALFRVAAAGTPWSFTALRKCAHREAVTTERKAETSTLWFSLLVLTSGHLWRTLKGQEIIKCDFKLEGSLWLRVKHDLGTGKPETATKVLNIWVWWNNSNLKQEEGYKFKVTRD